MSCNPTYWKQAHGFAYVDLNIKLVTIGTLNTDLNYYNVAKLLPTLPTTSHLYKSLFLARYFSIPISKIKIKIVVSKYQIF